MYLNYSPCKRVYCETLRSFQVGGDESDAFTEVVPTYEYPLVILVRQVPVLRDPVSTQITNGCSRTEKYIKQAPLMAHSHYTGQGQGSGLGPRMMDFYITLCTVHTTQGQGQRQGTIVITCKLSLEQGNLFALVCQSFCSQRVLCMMSLSVWLPGPMFLLGGRLYLWSHVPSGRSLSRGSLLGRSLSGRPSIW